MLFPPEDGEYVVRAELPAGSDRAPVESEPFAVTMSTGREGLILQPEIGGTLVVVIRPAPGEDAAGVIVGITDGGGDRRTMRSDTMGIARFEDLRPGSWVVQHMEEELTGGGSSSTSYPDASYAIPWNCDVRSGATVEFALQLEE